MVYEAEDTERGRFLALKFLPLAKDPQALKRASPIVHWRKRLRTALSARVGNTQEFQNCAEHLNRNDTTP